LRGFPLPDSVAAALFHLRRVLGAANARNEISGRMM
jgi:hypothetical protein